MSQRSTNITIAIAVASLIIMAVPTWDALDRRGVAMLSMVLAVVWLIGLCGVVYSVWRAVRSRDEVTKYESAMLTLREDTKVEIDGARKRAQKEVETATTELETQRALVGRLKQQHQEELLNARMVAIHSATWGMGGPYSRDVTFTLKELIKLSSTVKISTGTLGAAGYPGEKKQLLVQFTCPCTGSLRSLHFQEGDTVDFEALCRN
jgi:hypothetical protein